MKKEQKRKSISLAFSPWKDKGFGWILLDIIYVLTVLPMLFIGAARALRALRSASSKNPKGSTSETHDYAHVPSSFNRTTNRNEWIQTFIRECEAEFELIKDASKEALLKKLNEVRSAMGFSPTFNNTFDVDFTDQLLIGHQFPQTPMMRVILEPYIRAIQRIKISDKKAIEKLSTPEDKYQYILKKVDVGIYEDIVRHIECYRKRLGPRQPNQSSLGVTIDQVLELEAKQDEAFKNAAEALGAKEDIEKLKMPFVVFLLKLDAAAFYSYNTPELQAELLAVLRNPHLLKSFTSESNVEKTVANASTVLSYIDNGVSAQLRMVNIYHLTNSVFMFQKHAVRDDEVEALLVSAMSKCCEHYLGGTLANYCEDPVAQRGAITIPPAEKLYDEATRLSSGPSADLERRLTAYMNTYQTALRQEELHTLGKRLSLKTK